MKQNFRFVGGILTFQASLATFRACLPAQECHTDRTAGSQRQGAKRSPGISVVQEPGLASSETSLVSGKGVLKEGSQQLCDTSLS